MDKRMTQEKAAGLIGISERQVRRIVKRIKTEGDVGIVHRGRGRESNRKISKKIRRKVIQLYKRSYWDFGPTLASEKLQERDGIGLSDETLRLWLIEEGLWEKGRKARVHRQWRERKACFGEMVQIDGSHHRWLEGRGPKLVLMGYIDDATGKVYARFYDYEGTIPALDSFLGYVKLNGIPQTVYVDRHTTYKSPKKNIWEDEKTFSEFEKALNRIGTRVIHAGSPQAKGRVERLFRTFQDRLIKEMRLAKIRTKEGANVFLEGYLPKFNERFEKEPKSEVDVHRAVPAGMVLERELSIQETRLLRNDNTIQYGAKFYQIAKGWTHRPKKVTVELRVDGSLHMRDGSRVLDYHRIEPPPKKAATPKIMGYCHMARTPKRDHPWRGGVGHGRAFSFKKANNGLDPASVNAPGGAILVEEGSRYRPDLTLSLYPGNPGSQRKKEAKKETKGSAAVRFATAGFQGPALRSQQLIECQKNNNPKPDISILANTGHF
jgi:hypothetical protein